MKRILAILLFLIFISNIVITVGLSKEEITKTQVEDIIEITITFPTLNELEFKSYQNKKIIMHPTLGYYHEPGELMLPTKNLLIAIPPDTRIEEIRLTEFNPITIQESLEIASYPPIFLPQKGIPNSQSNEHQTTIISTKNVELKSQGTLGKYFYVSLSVSPFTYQKETNTLAYDKESKLIIKYSQNEKNSSIYYQEILKDTSFDQKASGLFINYHEIKKYYRIEKQQSNNEENDATYLIITTESLLPAISDSTFIDWKKTIGHNIRTITLTNTSISSQEGKDLAEKIRNFLREYYTLWNIKYVLFIGDYTTIPMRYCSPNPNWLDGTVPTDTYYADLSFPDDQSWDSNHDGYYGVYGQDKPDFLPEIYIGRIPTEDAEKIMNTLEKIVSYEQSTEDWKKNALHGGAMLFYANEDHDTQIDHDIDGCNALDAIETDLMNDWTVSHYSEHEGLSPSTYQWKPLSEASFTDDWRNQKYAIVNWAAHGAPTSIGRVIWDTDDGDDIPEHDNNELIWGSFLNTYSSLEDDYPSIVFAVSCNVGYPEPTGDGNLGIDLLTKESFGSAVAVCSATRGAAVSADWSVGHSGAEALCYEFNHYLISGPNGAEPVGMALYDSKYFVHHNYGWDHYLEYQNMFDYNLYGDPSMIQKGTINGSPTIPIINGPTSGKINTEYTYSITSEDPLMDDVYYLLDWGDNSTDDEWVGPFDSAETISIFHSWNEKGLKIVRVKAKNDDGKESKWNSIEVSMSKTKHQLFFDIIKEKKPILHYLLSTFFQNWNPSGSI